jgi:hypothetical protein
MEDTNPVQRNPTTGDEKQSPNLIPIPIPMLVLVLVLGVATLTRSIPISQKSVPIRVHLWLKKLHPPGSTDLKPTHSTTMNSIEECRNGAILLLWQSWSRQEQKRHSASPSVSPLTDANHNPKSTCESRHGWAAPFYSGNVLGSIAGSSFPH